MSEERNVRKSVLFFSVVALLAAGLIVLFQWRYETHTEEEYDSFFPLGPPKPHPLIPEILKALESAESVTVYSLYPWEYEESARSRVPTWAEGRFVPALPRGKPKFHGFPILGSITLEEKEKRTRIFNGLLSDVDMSWPIAMCFEPRHGARADLADGRSVDMVICYKCARMEINFPGREVFSVQIRGNSWALLEKPLREAGIEVIANDATPF